MNITVYCTCGRILITAHKEEDWVEVSPCVECTSVANDASYRERYEDGVASMEGGD